MTAGLQVVGLVTWVAALAGIYALVEVHTEGPAGWAANLPTWRREPPRWLRRVWGGRLLTGYHVYLFTFRAMVFHLPHFCGVRNHAHAEVLIFASLMLFWILEDFLWFVFNPAWRLTSFRPGQVPWHKHWFLGVPVDYIIFGFISAALFALSFWLHTPTGGAPL